MLPELSILEKYSNTELIRRYNKDYPNNSLPAEVALKEIIKYLWLTQKHSQEQKNHPDDESLDFPCVVHAEMAQMDDMWHTFLLFTRDYHDFCQQYFGYFIHHAPATHEEKLAPEEFEIKFTRYLTFVYDQLGEETVKTWFADLLTETE